jgi:hypothetical protein
MLWSPSICGLGFFFLPLFTEVPRRWILGTWAQWKLYVRRSPDRRSASATSAAARAPPLSTSRSLMVSAIVYLPTKNHSKISQ